MIELRDIQKNYHVGGGELPVLKGITLDIRAGEYIALMGSSGSGKTTLMNLLGSLDHTSAGTYQLDGIDVSALSVDELAVFRNEYVGFVFQNFNLLPRTSALDNVLLPTLYAQDGRTKQERVRYAQQLLETVGLGGRMDHAPNQLSGGERQRVAIARALINRPKLVLADEPTGNLDSTTEQEILELFRRLNREHHLTLVVVTHEAEVAAQADRIVRLRDGIVAGDERRGGIAAVAAAAVNAGGAVNVTAPVSPPEVGFQSKRPHYSLAATINAVVVATLALRRNLLRTLLTMLGVIIGVSSVVMVIELSGGSSHAIKDTVASMGASMLTVTATHTPHRRYVPLTPDDVEFVSDACPSVQLTAPLVLAQIQLVRGNQRWRPTFAFGTSPEYLDARNWGKPDRGQLFTRQDVDEAARVCLIGQTIADELFEGDYAIGESLRVNGVSLRVVGVLSPKGGDVIGNDQDDIIVAPWTTFKYRLNESSRAPRRVANFADQMPNLNVASHQRSTRNEHLHQIYVQAYSPEHVARAREEIRQALSERHSVDANVFQIQDMTEVSRVTEQVVAGLSALGFVIGGVSLLVGGVGIMNIMLVSVTERTREIGLRMAVGASRRAILRQFLIEATVLCVIGGLFGIAVGHASSMVVTWWMGWPSIFSLWAPTVALGVALTVGVIFGFYPARKASLLDPIDALRYE